MCVFIQKISSPLCKLAAHQTKYLFKIIIFFLSNSIFSLIKSKFKITNIINVFAPNSIRLFFDIVLDGMHKSKS